MLAIFNLTFPFGLQMKISNQLAFRLRRITKYVFKIASVAAIFPTETIKIFLSISYPETSYQVLSQWPFYSGEEVKIIFKMGMVVATLDFHSEHV